MNIRVEASVKVNKLYTDELTLTAKTAPASCKHLYQQCFTGTSLFKFSKQIFFSFSKSKKGSTIATRNLWTVLYLAGMKFQPPKHKNFATPFCCCCHFGVENFRIPENFLEWKTRILNISTKYGMSDNSHAICTAQVGTIGSLSGRCFLCLSLGLGLKSTLFMWPGIG